MGAVGPGRGDAPPPGERVRLEPDAAPGIPARPLLGPFIDHDLEERRRPAVPGPADELLGHAHRAAAGSAPRRHGAGRRSHDDGPGLELYVTQRASVEGRP